MTGAEQLAATVRRELAEAGDPSRAAGMRAYLHSALPCRGVSLPTVRQIVRRAAASHPPEDRAAWEAATLTLWREAGYREERYAAIALTGLTRFAAQQDPHAIRVYEELIVTGAWWDLVDEVASRRVGPILRSHPGAMTPIVRAWSRDGDLWKRRAAIICQVGARRETDTALLTECIDANLGDRDFFIRKAIGWALREHAKIDPAWVAAFVAARTDRLSGLSQREALKHARGLAGGPMPE